MRNLENEFNLTLHFVFIVGKSTSSNLQTKDELKKENETFGDILETPFDDIYTTLTLKSLYMLRWFTKKNNENSYLLKIDDDVFLNLPRVLSLISSHFVTRNMTTDQLLTGFVHKNAQPIRNPFNKWSVSYNVYGESVFPDYLAGPCYLMNWNVANQLFSVFMSSSKSFDTIFPLEDVFVTGILPSLIPIERTHNSLFSHVRVDPVDACTYKEMISVHDMKINEIQQLTNQLRNSDGQEMSLSCNQ